MKNLFKLIVLIITSLSTFAQTAPFNIALEPVNIAGLGGLQSYAFGQHNNKWLIVGGRLDGLHRRQPFASFDLAGHNNQLIVIDPVVKQMWVAPLTSLPIAIQEQLSSTNLQFFQDGDYLYCIGGYGYSATLADHTTYPNLTAIKVSDVINSIISNSNFTSFFRQITDTAFQVTGGKLRRIDNIYYLLGGQKFMGRYNPMGPSHGPGFIQEYTNAIKKFTISDNGTIITINHLLNIVDSVNFHRRDYNAESQILSNGNQGITMFSGVFQYNIDLPFLNSVTVDSSSYMVNNTFQQYYNHYHCPVLPLYSASNNQMHNVFFGGIAQYYDSAGVLVQDNNVPFTQTIARITRNSSGVLSEYKLPVEMPALIGAGAEFILNENVPHFSNGVVKLDSITNDTTLAGYIYGGISSTAKNIFWVNTGVESSASSQIFKVLLLQNNPLALHKINEQGTGTLKMMAIPNPNNGIFEVKYYLKENGYARVRLVNEEGKILDDKIEKNKPRGEHIYHRKIKKLQNGGIFFISIETDYEKATQKIIVEP